MFNNCAIMCLLVFLNLNSVSSCHPRVCLKSEIARLTSVAISWSAKTAEAIIKLLLLVPSLNPGSPESSIKTNCLFIFTDYTISGEFGGCINKHE